MTAPYYHDHVPEKRAGQTKVGSASNQSRDLDWIEPRKGHLRSKCMQQVWTSLRTSQSAFFQKL